MVGSLLEREPVVMPEYQWDISDPVACLEVVFGSRRRFPHRPGGRPGHRRGTVGSGRRAEGALRAARGHLAPAGAGSAGDHGHRHLGLAALRTAAQGWRSPSWSALPSIDSAAGDGRLAHQAEDGQRVLRALRTDLAAMFAEEWPADFKRLQGRPAGVDALLHGGRLRVLPRGEGQPSTSRTSPPSASAWAWKPTKSVGGISARDILKAVQQPCAGTVLEAALQGLLRGHLLPGPDRQGRGLGRRHGQPGSQSRLPGRRHGRLHPADRAGHELPRGVQPLLRSRRRGRGPAGQGTLARPRPRLSWTAAPSSPGRTARAPA